MLDLTAEIFIDIHILVSTFPEFVFIVIYPNIYLSDCVNEYPEILIILDSSGSINDKGYNWYYMTSFGQRLLDSLRSKPNARFAYIRFSGDAQIDEYLTR